MRLHEVLLLVAVGARLASGCTPAERQEAQTALEAADIGCAAADLAQLDQRARDACAATAAARKAAEAALVPPADGGAP